MSKLPYFRWYPADAETDEKYSAMTNAERGFYHRCLNRAWINDGLPADERELVRVLGESIASLRKLWPRVGECFVLDGERYRNKRQEEERTHAKTKSERASDSVRTRYLRSTNVCTNVPTNDPLRAYESDSDSSASSEGECEGKPGKADNVPPQLDEQWLEFQRLGEPMGAGTKDWQAAHFAWRILDGLQRQAAIDGLKARHDAQDDPCWRGLPKSYLQGRKWERRVQRPRSASNGTRSEEAEAASLKLLQDMMGRAE